MPSSPAPSSIAELCKTVIEALIKFPHDSQDGTDSRGVFQTEVQTLQRFSGLIDRVHDARPSRSTAEEEHWKALGVLLNRCRRTLQNLHERLVKSASEDYELHYNEPWKITYEDRKPVAISTLRAHVNLYTQTIQMSLQAFNM